MELLGETVKVVAEPEALSDVAVLELVTTVVNVCAEVLSWEFSFVEAWQIPPTQQLIRPGPRWRRYLVRPDFLGAVFDVYHRVRRCAARTACDGCGGGIEYRCVCVSHVRRLILAVGRRWCRWPMASRVSTGQRAAS